MVADFKHWSLVLVLVLTSSFHSGRATEPQQNRTNITVYHVNQANYSVTPTNMNTADIRGDIYFAMTSRSLPVECGQPNMSATDKVDCSNSEINANGLAITKLILEVDGTFGPYEYCNVANGTYWCGCKFGKHGAIHCKPGEVRYLVGDRTIVGNKRRPGPPKNGSVDGRIHMWESNVRERLTGQGIPGHWYSTPAAGQCGVAGSNCTWRLVEPVKKVWKNCSDAAINSYVELTEPKCFNACAAATPSGKLNRTSSCYVGCFFDAVLGPHSDTVYNGTGGLSADELIALWDAPFAKDSDCINLL